MNATTKTAKKPATLTVEQLAERVRVNTRMSEISDMEEGLMTQARGVAERLGVNVLSADYGELTLSFGTGLVELRVRCAELAGGQLVGLLAPGSTYKPVLTCRRSAYSLGSDATLDTCEAQGLTLLEAARFGRVLLALLNPA